MDFNLTQEQKLLSETVSGYMRDEVAPLSRQLDKDGIFPTKLYEPLKEMGILGMSIPVAYNGSGLDAQSIAVVIEDIARYDGSMALNVAAHCGLGCGHINSFGSDKQKEYYLPQLTNKHFASWCLTEPGSGSDAGAMSTSAQLNDGVWVLNGSKMFITNGNQAEFFIVMAVSDPEKGKKGITAFIVHRDTPGLSLGQPEDKLGLRSSETVSVHLSDVRVPDGQRLGERGHAFIQTLALLDRGRISIGSMAVGIARGAFEEARKYAEGREQFGHKIASFAVLRSMFADMATEIDAARLLVQRAAWVADNDQKNVTQYASMAKLFSSEMANRVCNKAIQILGGYGYTKDYPVERYWRDARLTEIGEGSSEVQRIVISRSLLKAPPLF